MADSIIPTITLAPRGGEAVTVTTNAGVTVFVTDEVTVYQTDTVEVTKSIFETSFIHITVTDTSTCTTTESITITGTIQALTSTPASPKATAKETTPLIPFIRPIESSTSLLPIPTPFCVPPLVQMTVPKYVDPFQVLSIVFGVFILFLLALLWLLVRRFYKMYRAERVLRKQLQTEGTEMPNMRMAVNEEGTHVVGEE